MIRAARAFLAALAYFTIVPLPPAATGDALDDGALAWWPLVGGMAGAVAGFFGWFVAWRLPGFGGLAAWIATVVLTGAIHVDGYLDCCDALLATATPQRRREILHDPHHGTFAIAGMAVAALLWVRALDRLAPASLPMTLAFTGIVARASALIGAWIFPYAAGGSMTAAFRRTPPWAPVALAVAVTCALAWFLGLATILLVPLGLIAGALLGLFAAQRLGGATGGDVYGAIAVVVEIAALLGFPELQALTRR